MTVGGNLKLGFIFQGPLLVETQTHILDKFLKGIMTDKSEKHRDKDAGKQTLRHNLQC